MVEHDYENAYRAHISRWGVGATLRGAREAGGETINDAATASRIRAAYIHALETEDYQQLPGWAHALSYARTYAEYLGLEPTPLVRRVREQIELRQHLAQPPEPSRRRRGGWRIAAGIVLMLGGIAASGWYFTSPAASLNIATVFDPLPRGLKSLINRTFVTVADTEATAGGSEPVETEEVLAVNIEIEPTARSARALAPAAPAPAAAAPTAATTSTEPGAMPIAASTAARFAPLRDTPAETAASSSEPEPSGTVMIATHLRDTTDRTGELVSDVILRARGTVWLTVEDATGRSLLAQQINEGALYRLPTGSGFTVTTDNAGAFEVYVEGALAGLMGPAGTKVTKLPVERLATSRADG
ncbi:MAG: DUF4115 domain-containing protein [Rhizobiales bacterium]|nr:DUF4115 domain-containing protein [Hyphomicrobiales bacterium]